MTEKLTGYIGTYTKKDSEGIYRFVLDLDNESMKSPELVAKVSNPTYLTPSRNGQYLYAVCKEGDQGGVCSFKIDEQTGALTKINAITKKGAPPCHLSVNKANTLLVTANYHTQELISYTIDACGGLKEMNEIKIHEGKGPHERQEKPHLHFSGFTKDERFVIVVDLGSDEITTYAVEKDLSLTKAQVYKTPSGSGPRHLAFHPNEKIAYVMTELSSSVLVLAYEKTTGVFSKINEINALPATYDGANDGSAVHVTSDGRFVYVGNRGHNSIAVFEVNPVDYTLSLVEHSDVCGDFPRDFVLTKNEAHMICANQNTGTLTLFSRDEHTGRLTVKKQDIVAPEAICVKYLN